MSRALDVAPRIRSALAEACAVDEEDVSPESALYEDLGADSLTIMETLSALEDELGIDLPESTSFATGLRTVGDVIEAFQCRAP
jgi:acyl carrier protein